MTGGSNQDTVNERSRLLTIFCIRMTELKYLYYSEEFVAIFLRSKEADVAKVKKNNQSIPILVITNSA